MTYLLRQVPAGTVAARGAQRRRTLVDGEYNGTSYGWFLLDDALHESVEEAVLPYLDPPNRLWYYRTSTDARFYDMSDPATLAWIYDRLPATHKTLLQTAFPYVDGTLYRHSELHSDEALVHAMLDAHLLDVDGVRGWAHPTLQRLDGGVHRREVVALFPSQYLSSTSSPTTRSPATPRTPRTPTSPTSPTSPPTAAKTTARRRRSSPISSSPPSIAKRTRRRTSSSPRRRRSSRS